MCSTVTGAAKQTPNPDEEHTSNTMLTVNPVALQVLTLLYQDLKMTRARSQLFRDQLVYEHDMQIMVLICELGRCLRATDRGMSGQPAGSTSWNWSMCPPFAFAEEVRFCGGEFRKV